MQISYTKLEPTVSKEADAFGSFHIGPVKVTPKDIFVKLVILAIIFPLVMWAWNGKPLF